MKRYARKAMGLLLGWVATGCSAGIESQQAGENSQDMVTDIVVARQPDGTFKHTTQKVTIAQRKAQGERRLERMRLRNEGVQAQLAPIDNDIFCQDNSLWIYNVANPSNWHEASVRCCLWGEGNDFVSNLCGGSFGYAKAFWTGESGGLYGFSPYPSYCGSSFESTDGKVPYPDCPNIDWFQLDF